MSIAASASASSIGTSAWPKRRMPRLSPSALAKAWPSTMPTSSVVWWKSMCRSPLARTVRSNSAVAGERGQHVVEEADAGGDVGLARPVERQGQRDVGFRGGAGEAGGAVHGGCSSAGVGRVPGGRVPGGRVPGGRVPGGGARGASGSRPFARLPRQRPARGWALPSIPRCGHPPFRRGGSWMMTPAHSSPRYVS